MTHSGGKPHAVGDRGQRYEISFHDRDGNQRRVFGWAESEIGAKQMASALETRTGWTDAKINDRHTGQVVQR
jgi:hypothetical protein